MVDDNGQQSDNFQKNNKLIITTKDNYELIIDINNNDLEAKIISKGKVQNTNYEIIYIEDGKEEKRVVRKGFSIHLKQCDTIKQGYSFIGWCVNQSGEGEIYEANSLYKPNENIKLYAIFGKVISFDPNGGVGEIEKKVIRIGEQIVLSQNINFTKEGYKFKEWNTKSDGSGISYSNSTPVTIDENIETLYDIWEWNNENWEVLWKQSSVNIAGVNNNYYEINATQSAYSWIEITTKEKMKLNNIKAIRLTMDCEVMNAGNAYFGIRSYKDSVVTVTTSGMKLDTNITRGTNQITTLDVSSITDNIEYYISIRLAPSNCKVKNLEFIY